MQWTDLLIWSANITILVLFIDLRTIRKRRRSASFSNAKRSQIRAAEILEESGFQVLTFSRGYSLVFDVDGRAYTDSIKVDLVAKKNGRHYLVKVVSGKQVPRLSVRDTREAVAGTCAVLDISRMLFVDVETGRVRGVQVKVKGRRTERLAGRLCWAAAGCLVGLGASFVLWWYFF